MYNLASKLVYCELCSSEIKLEANNPPFRFKSRLKPSQSVSNNNNNIAQNNNDYFVSEPFEQEFLANSNSQVDDFDLINYLEPDNNCNYTNFIIIIYLFFNLFLPEFLFSILYKKVIYVLYRNKL